MKKYAFSGEKVAMDKNVKQFIGLTLNNQNQKFEVTEYIASGAVGCMFKCYDKDFDEYRAVKFILKNKLKPGWEQEIIKTIQLRQQENVVMYYTNGECQINESDYVYIMWAYIPNETLKTLIINRKISMALLLDVIETVLEVFYACEQKHIIHGDLHSGNILIEHPNEINIDKTYRKIWITDFGRIKQEDNEDYLDDYVGLINIVIAE
jgi:serine/threonine protein kinase